MLFVALVGITGSCLLVMVAELGVWIWDKLAHPKKEKSAATAATVNSARVKDTYNNIIILYPERRRVK